MKQGKPGRLTKHSETKKANKAKTNLARHKIHGYFWDQSDIFHEVLARAIPRLVWIFPSDDVTSYDRCSLEWFGGESSV